MTRCLVQYWKIFPLKNFKTIKQTSQSRVVKVETAANGEIL